MGGGGVFGGAVGAILQLGVGIFAAKARQDKE